MSHTPGPWVVEDSRKLKRKSLRSEMLMVVAVGGGMPGLIVNSGKVTPTDEANARLIAAAPDLLAALEGVMDYVIAFEAITSAGEAGQKSAIAVADAAIKKAKGL